MYKEIPNYPNYVITPAGEVFNQYGHQIRPWEHKARGGYYLRVTLYNQGRKWNARLHRLVALTFLPNPEGLSQVHHIDGDTFNNRLENLEWVTAQENIYFKA